MGRLGHAYFSAEKSRDPGSARRPPPFSPPISLAMMLHSNTHRVSSRIIVGMGRLELPILSEYDSESYAYTNSATCPWTALYTERGFVPKVRFLAPITTMGILDLERNFKMDDQEVYPAGDSMPHIFPKHERPVHKLPLMFDDTCKHCQKQMEQMPAYLCTAHRPFAVFQCEECKVRLMLFNTETAPLFVWRWPHEYSTDFSIEISNRIKARDHSRERQQIRELGVYLPP